MTVLVLIIDAEIGTEGEVAEGFSLSVVRLAGQNALQRLLAFMLEEHCCSMGLVAGLHNLVRFGSEILTCEIAVASASTRAHSSLSSEWPLLDGVIGLEYSSEEALILRVIPGWRVNSTTWFIALDFKGSDFNIRSV